jgi:hypothetical protein
MLFIIAETIIWLLGDSKFLIGINKYLVCLCLIFCFYSALKIGAHLFHPYILFLFAFGIFIVSRIVLDIFKIEGSQFNARTGGGGSSYFSDEISRNILALIAFCLLFFNLGALYAFRRTSKYAVSSDNSPIIIRQTGALKNIKNLGLCLFFAGLIPYSIRLYSVFQYILANGYLARLQEEELVSNPILKIGDDVCLFGAYLFFAAYPRGKWFYIVSLCYIVTIFGQLGGGARGLLVTSTFGFLSYLSFRNIKINKKAIVCFGLIGALLINAFQIVGENRENGFVKITEQNRDKIATKIFFLFFWQQGNSIQTIGYMQEKAGDIQNKFLYFVSPIFNTIAMRKSALGRMLGIGIPAKQSIEQVNTSYELQNKLSYMINQRTYFEGYGIGGSFIIDAYAAGGFFGVMVISFIWMYAWIYFIERYKYTWFGIVILFSLMHTFFIAPRAVALRFFEWLPRSLFYVGLIQFYCNMIKQKGVSTHE